MLPKALTSGTTVVVTPDLSGYPSPEWSASLTLRGPTQIDIEAVGNDSQHVFTVNAQATSSWIAGRYGYSLRVKRTDSQSLIDEVIQIEEGALQILPNLLSITPPFFLIPATMSKKS